MTCWQSSVESVGGQYEEDALQSPVGTGFRRGMTGKLFLVWPVMTSVISPPRSSCPLSTFTFYLGFQSHQSWSIQSPANGIQPTKSKEDLARSQIGFKYLVQQIKSHSLQTKYSASQVWAIGILYFIFLTLSFLLFLKEIYCQKSMLVNVDIMLMNIDMQYANL